MYQGERRLFRLSPERKRRSSVGNGKRKDLIGKRVSEVLPELKGELDVEVEVNLYRRKYNGKRRKDTDSFRLVAIYNEEDDVYYLNLRVLRATSL